MYSDLPAVLAVAALVTLAGCSSSAPKPEPFAPEPTAQAQAEPGVSQTGNHFEIERAQGCRIKWDADLPMASGGQITIDVNDRCRFDGGLTKSLKAYGQLLDAVITKYSKDKIRFFSSSSWHVIGAWDQEMALAAMESGLWKAHLAKHAGKPGKVDRVFVEIFNQGNVARHLAEVFEERGLSIRLKSVHSVSVSAFRKLPFAHEYAAYVDSKTPVPYTARTFVFEIKPL
jgi:hypothetical protein